MRTEARKTLLIGCMNSAHIAEAATPIRDAELAIATRGGMIESRHHYEIGRASCRERV